MKPFDYYRVATVEQAVTLLEKHRQKAAILAGGSDLLGMMKDGIAGPEMKPPQHLIDIKGIKGLAYIKDQPSGMRIGAATTLADIASSEVITTQYPLIGEAVRQVAVPQIRNVATLGGNLCQRPRCWYFRGKLFTDCLRKGGGTCYGHEKDAENQYHAIFGGESCCMVYPSDMAPALIALNARAEIVGPKGKRSLPLEKFYISPQTTFLQETVLSPEEMLVAVEIPAASRSRKGIYVKLRERQAFDFALVSVAVSAMLEGSQVVDARVVFGGVAPFPMRSTKAEATLKGKELHSAVAEACAAAVQGASPLGKNGYKTEAAKNVLEQALSQLA
jgi:xanthine dehydrogenase YagS FAD-binding subunit